MLRRMGRQYTIEHYLERLAALRAAVPGLALSTDVIVGFCGETEAEYEATLRLLETVRYDQVFAAAYSERPGTPATRMTDDVPAAEKRRRLNELLGVQEAIGLERNRAWVGRETEVLVDTVVPPRSHEHDDEDAAGHRRSRATRSRTCPTASRHLAGPLAREQARPRGGRTSRWSASSSGSAWSTAGRTRSGARSPEPGRRCPERARESRGTGPADRPRRPDRHRQDGPRHRARGAAARPRHPRGDRVRRLAAGVPRPRHRDGQGDDRGAGTRRPPRHRPRRARRAVHGRRLPGACPRRVASRSGAAAGSGSSPAARGSGCAPS